METMEKTRPQWPRSVARVVVAVVAAVVVLFLALWLTLGVTQAAVWSHGVSDDGLTLTVEYAIGNGDTVLWKRIHETADAVVVDVRILEPPPGSARNAAAYLHEVTFELEQPLGDRAVVARGQG